MQNLIRALFGREDDKKVTERTFAFRVTNWDQVLKKDPEAIEHVKHELVHESVFPDRIDVSQQLFRVYTEELSVSATRVLETIRRFGFDAEFSSINDT